MLDGSTFITTDPITDYTLRVMNTKDSFITDNVFTPQPVKKKKFSKYQYDLSNLRERVVKKSSKAVADEVDYGVFTVSATAELRKLRGQVDPADEEDFDEPVADIEQDVALTVQEGLWIGRERETITKLAAANFASGLTTTLGAGAVWSGNGSDPVADVTAARIAVRTQSGVDPSAMALSWTGFQYLKQNPSIIDRVKYTMGDKAIDVQVLCTLFGLKNIYVCGGISTTALEGNATQTLADMWNNFAIVYVEGVPGRRTVCFGNNFVRKQLYGRVYEEPQRGADQAIRWREQGWWYTQEVGLVDTAASGKFAAGYRISNLF
jgi:hypothetical protein